MSISVGGIAIPDSKLAREITDLVRDTESDLLFHHSSRVYYWAALAGQRRGLKFDSELLYAGAMFHDMGVTVKHSSPDKRFEVDGANAAADFLRSHGIPEHDVERVWIAIALHATPGVPEFMHPVIALVTAGVEMDDWASSTTNTATRNARWWCTRTRVPSTPGKTSFRRSTTASSTSPTQRLPT
jgi:hypothetical protein